MELIMRPHLREGCSMGETKDRGGRGWGEERKAIVQVWCTQDANWNCFVHCGANSNQH